MFGFLFDEEEDQETGSVGKEGGKKINAISLPFPRGKTGLCGLQNQGATCYLNSLIQTLFFTPEFRESLFHLGASELGNILDKDRKVRVIPLQLQRVFTRLLLLNQESISTACLTESFGWTGAEGSEQHDIQELNRILFSAIETSLVGTSGEDLIRKHYHGTSVTQVICQQCGNTSEREEDYFDLPVTLMGCNSLEESLQMLYIALEVLEGRNQYRCGSCDKLVDAIKSAKLRTLPSVLTFNLLRFSYDFKKGERFKETKRYKFPLQLNMDAFCESESSDNTYELYSVIIHGGSCYGGHYHAYIRDLEGLGSWSQPEKDEVKVVQRGGTGRDTVVSCDNPVDLMRQLLIQLGGSATLDQLCQNMNKQTGMSWNKRYKNQYGPLTKFFKKHSDVFSYGNGWISLKSEVSCLDDEEKWQKVGNDTTQKPSRKSDHHTDNTRCQNGANLDEHSIKLDENENFSTQHESWFDFNDSRVSCMREKDIQSQFAGRESAYMLFYRRKGTHHDATGKYMPGEVLGRLKQLIPVYLVAEVDELNKELEKKREDYDIALNQICVTVHFSSHFTVKDGVLVSKQGISTDPAVITLDRRKIVKELRNAVGNFGQRDFQGDETFVLHTAKELPAGMHLYQQIQADELKSLMELGIYDGTKVFVWNGREIDGHSVRPGTEHEPLLLTFAYSVNAEESQYVELQKAFPKSCTLGELKVIVAELFGLEVEQTVLSVFRNKRRNEVVVEELGADKESYTLSELQFCDGERLTAERRDEESSHSVLAALEAERQNNLLSVVVEVRCLDNLLLGFMWKLGYLSGKEETRNAVDPWPVIPLCTTRDQLISEMKVQILKETNLSLSTGDCRLRIDDDAQGRGPPLYEHLSVEDAGVRQGQKLVLEPGTGPKEGEIAVQFQVICKNNETKTEIIMEKSLTISQCLQKALPQIKDLEAGNEWHLRKTNWLGEPAQVLYDQDATLEDEYITNGDTLLIEEGRLPPKGFIRLSLWISSTATQKSDEQGVVSWITSGKQGLLGTLTPDVTNADTTDTLAADELQTLGEVEIGQDATLYDLKIRICTLPLLCENIIPKPRFLRLQELVDGYPMRVFRNLDKSLRHLKISSSTQLFVKVLKEVENLSQSAVLLNVLTRIPGTRTYHPPYQVVFDPRDGATPTSLGQFLAECSEIPPDRLGMAKYFRQKYLWLPITTSTLDQGKRKGGKKKVNLRHAPVHLQDGDVIGIKDVTCDPLDDKDDFSTAEDDEGREKLKKCEEEKRDRRKKSKKPWSNRPEAQLKIHVDDFR